MRISVERVQSALRDREHVPASREPGDRLAAVAAILREGRLGAEILLIRRARNAGDPWSGHMALPGGRHEAGDADLLHTAIRETHEEIGLSLDGAAGLLGRLDDLSASARGRRAGLIVAPFVFNISGNPDLVLSEREVDEALWAPIAPLMRGEHDTTLPWEWEGTRLQLPGFDFEGRIVWGLTHRMLQGLFSLLDEDRRTGYEAFE